LSFASTSSSHPRHVLYLQPLHLQPSVNLLLRRTLLYLALSPQSLYYPPLLSTSYTISSSILTSSFSFSHPPRTPPTLLQTLNRLCTSLLVYLITYLMLYLPYILLGNFRFTSSISRSFPSPTLLALHLLSFFILSSTTTLPLIHPLNLTPLPHKPHKPLINLSTSLSTSCLYLLTHHNFMYLP
jgi:hypothetical protein